MQVEELEDFVARYSGKVLHPNHVLVVDKVYNLAKMYGRMEGYGADVLTDEQLKTKRDLCERALKVLNVIMPGKSYIFVTLESQIKVPQVIKVPQPQIWIAGLYCSANYKQY